MNQPKPNSLDPIDDAESGLSRESHARAITHHTQKIKEMTGRAKRTHQKALRAHQYAFDVFGQSEPNNDITRIATSLAHGASIIARRAELNLGPRE